MSNDAHDEAFWTDFRNYAKDRHPMVCDCDVCERDDAMEKAQRNNPKPIRYTDSMSSRSQLKDDLVTYGVGLPVPSTNGEVGIEELVMWAVDHASRTNWQDTFEKFLEKYEVRRR